MAERGGFEYHSSVLCSCFRLCLATLKCSKIKGSNAVRVGISGNADFSGFVLICHISATREKGAKRSLFLLLVASRLRTLIRLPIFQGFIEVVPHSVPHTTYQPHRESGLTLIGLTHGLLHSRACVRPMSV